MTNSIFNRMFISFDSQKKLINDLIISSKVCKIQAERILKECKWNYNEALKKALENTKTWSEIKRINKLF